MNERKTDEFEVVTDAGRSFVIYELTKFYDTPAQPGGESEEAGTKRYVTSVGVSVNCEGQDFLIGLQKTRARRRPLDESSNK